MNRARNSVLCTLVSLFSKLLEGLAESLPVIWIWINECRKVESWVVQDVFVRGRVGSREEKISDFVVDALIILDLYNELADALVSSSPDQLWSFVFYEWVIELPQVLFLVNVGRYLREQRNLFSTGLSDQVFLVSSKLLEQRVDLLWKEQRLHILRYR
jgi:hypothetical protein